MKNIHCPNDLGFINIFEKNSMDCQLEEEMNNCFHCWSSSIAKIREDAKKDGVKEFLDMLLEKDIPVEIINIKDKDGNIIANDIKNKEFLIKSFSEYLNRYK